MDRVLCLHPKAAFKSHFQKKGDVRVTYKINKVYNTGTNEILQVGIEVRFEKLLRSKHAQRLSIVKLFLNLGDS